MIKGKVDIFLINETKLDESFPSNQFTMSGCKFIRDRNKLKNENPSDIEIPTIEKATRKTLVAGILNR